MIERIDVVLGKEEEIEQWMELVRKINAQFPGLKSEEEIEEHKKTVLTFMQRHEAFCVKSKDKIVGEILFSRTYNTICFLGVDKEYRRNGIARSLVLEAMVTMDQTKEITVTTYCEEDENGVAPRALYKKLGFVEGDQTEEFGYPCQILILHPSVSSKPKHGI
ncbi:MAG: GNAT family N-acetyltransferase [bacterium]|nr:GNAT family N-acetyltransferase [bacterium]